MLQKHPHVKYIRLCEQQDIWGRRHDMLIIDTDLEISSQERRKKDFLLIELAACVREFQIEFQHILGPFEHVEIHGHGALKKRI